MGQYGIEFHLIRSKRMIVPLVLGFLVIGAAKGSNVDGYYSSSFPRTGYPSTHYPSYTFFSGYYPSYPRVGYSGTQSGYGTLYPSSLPEHYSATSPGYESHKASFPNSIVHGYYPSYPRIGYSSTQAGYGTLAPSYIPQRPSYVSHETSDYSYPSHRYYPGYVSYDGYYPNYPRGGYSLMSAELFELYAFNLL